MQTARGKALSTRLLLLLEVHNRRHTQLKTLAERLDVTVQAVSDYLKRLSNEGLVEHVGGAWRPTKRGTAYLHESMRELRSFLDEAAGSLRMIDETYAIADGRLHAQQEVGLYLKDGRLYAGGPRGAASRGRAQTEGDAGQLVLVGDLRGLLELKPAPITFIAHPPFPTGPALDRARRELRRQMDGKSRRLIAAHDHTSLAWVWALGLEVDLEFAPLASAQEAAQRGVPVVYFVPHVDLSACESRLLEAQAQASEPIAQRSVQL